MSKPERVKLKTSALRGSMAPTLVTLDLTFDAGKLVVEYEPKEKLIDRDGFAEFVASVMHEHKESHAEEMVQAVAQAVAREADPLSLVVTGAFRPRSGVGLTAVVER